MLVGHNPEMETLLHFLVDEPIKTDRNPKCFPTATLAVFSFNGAWDALSKQCAHLIALIKPKSLPRTFSYPSSNQPRIRPAYYYTQSAVIPYRERDGIREILVISSSKNNHYLIPKGIKEPGMTAQQSAAKEAYEEAGVKGIVAESPVGSYQYEKWEAQCTVTVYPMQVTEVLAPDRWPESHRQRCWLRIQQAAKVLNEKALADLVLQLKPNSNSNSNL